MKRIYPVLVLCALFAAALGVIAKAQSQQQSQHQTAASQVGTPFAVPYDARLSDPVKTYRALDPVRQDGVRQVGDFLPSARGEIG